ncbi:MAG TPA: CDP-diacylglycerol--serine O-phosphatidyltransferase [Tepidisphaeraceae bacterium]|nr:CDP-diacylglycerol--serine O-phosphatidyltransferase [Tepidisphaeraceae bacterium]
MLPSPGNPAEESLPPKAPLAFPGEFEARDDRRLRRRRLPGLARKFRRRERDEEKREARRLRIRRHGRRAYIRSAYSLPSLATLGNAVCGFGAMYVAALDPNPHWTDRWTQFFFEYQFLAAAYLIFAAMIFDGLDGRLARFTRHTTDFGGQLDSMADVISFGCAPAFLALQLFHFYHPELPPIIGRLVWAIGALYVSCAAIRLARFNVSNEHGEQHHFSFLGLPSPGAGAAVAGLVLMQQDLWEHATLTGSALAHHLSSVCVWLLPFVVLLSGLLMVSAIRYPHLINRHLRGRRSIGRLLMVLAALLLLVIVHRYTLGIATLAYVLWGLCSSSYLRLRRKPRPAV